MLKMVIGPSSGSMMTGPTPTEAFVTPTNGSTVPLTFDIVVAASETGGTIAHVDITSGGQSIASLTSAPYKKTVTAPQDGMYDLTATAYDSAGNFQSATVSFTAMTGAPPQNTGCTQDSDCNMGLVCQNSMCVQPGNPSACSTPCPTGQTCQSDGTCKPDGVGGGGGGGGGGGNNPAPGEIGSSCTDGSQCNSGLCASLGNQHFCTSTCDPANASSCPSGNSCVAAGADHICEPNGASGGTGVGCSAIPGAQPGGEAILALCLVLAFGLAVRRRRV
jgi:hypothetical protein